MGCHLTRVVSFVSFNPYGTFIKGWAITTYNSSALLFIIKGNPFIIQVIQNQSHSWTGCLLAHWRYWTLKRWLVTLNRTPWRMYTYYWTFYVQMDWLGLADYYFTTYPRKIYRNANIMDIPQNLPDHLKNNADANHDKEQHRKVLQPTTSLTTMMIICRWWWVPAEVRVIQIEINDQRAIFKSIILGSSWTFVEEDDSGILSYITREEGNKGEVLLHELSLYSMPPLPNVIVAKYNSSWTMNVIWKKKWRGEHPVWYSVLGCFFSSLVMLFVLHENNNAWHMGELSCVMAIDPWFPKTHRVHPWCVYSFSNDSYCWIGRQLNAD